MKEIPLSLQLWSLRADANADFAGTVGRVAELGYTGVETAGFGNLDATRASHALAAVRLDVSGMHVPLASLQTDIVRIAADAHQLSTSHVVCPDYPGDAFSSAERCGTVAAELDEIGARLRALGLHFHYHNHAHELALIDGRSALELVLERCDPANVSWEADVYWLHVGGQVPAESIRRHASRIRLVHLKDEYEFGSGPMDFGAVFAAINELENAAWLVVEIEKYRHAPLEAARRSIEYFRNHWLGVRPATAAG